MIKLCTFNKLTKDDILNNYNPNLEIKKGNIISIHISDIHFGKINPKVQYDILKEQFINKILLLPIIDMIAITGDLFDHKVMLNSDVTLYASLFIKDCVELCNMKNSTLVLLAGTKEHDADQLKLFYHYLNTNVNIEIIEQVKFIVVKNCRILCIPELYGKSKEYYEEYLYKSGLYDMCLVHGTYKGSIFNKNESILDSDREPVFDINHFSFCKGPIISGHVHVSNCYDKYYYYTGSPIRTCFGEEQPKGYMILLYNLDSRMHSIQFEEIKSFRYDTINLDYMLTKDPKEIISYVDNLKKNGIDYIRLVFTIDSSNINIIRDYYRNNHYIKIKYDAPSKIGSIKTSQEVLDQYREYDYILDKSLSEYDIFCKYVNQQMGEKFITVEDLIEVLKEDI